MSNHPHTEEPRRADSWPPPGRTRGHQWAGLLAAGGQISVALDIPGDGAADGLMDSLIPALVGDAQTPGDQQWTADQVTIWLTTLADHLKLMGERGRSGTDIQLPDLWMISRIRPLRWIPESIAAIPIVVFAVWLAPRLPWALVVGCLCLVPAVFLSIRRKDRLERIELAGLRTTRGRQRLAFGLASGLAFGVGFTLVTVAVFLLTETATPLGVGLAIGLATGLAVGLAGGLTFGLTAGIAAAPAPTRLVRQCINYVLTTALAFGLTTGLAFGLAIGLLVGLDDEVYNGRVEGLISGLSAGLVIAATVGLTAGLTAGHGFQWIRYLIGVRSAARHHRLPTRPAAFLDWCLSVGLMRMAGTSAQFRHSTLQEKLTRRTE